jgi:hypothetical protein
MALNNPYTLLLMLWKLTSEGSESVRWNKLNTYRDSASKDCSTKTELKARKFGCMCVWVHRDKILHTCPYPDNWMRNS